MERSIEIGVAIQCLIIGLSHLIRPQAWIQFIERLKELGHPGMFAYGFLYLWPGTVVVVGHWKWTGIPGALTGIGGLLMLKAAHCFLFPERQLRALSHVSADSETGFKLFGTLSVAFAGLVGYSVWKS